jgi:hypothetical protein
MPNIMFTKNGQGPFPVPSTGQFGSMIGSTSSAKSPQEALQKLNQQLPKIAPGFMVKNGLVDVKMKDGYYLIETQNGGRKSRRNKTRRGKRSRKGKRTRRHRR